MLIRLVEMSNMLVDPAVTCYAGRRQAQANIFVMHGADYHGH